MIVYFRYIACLVVAVALFAVPHCVYGQGSGAQPQPEDSRGRSLSGRGSGLNARPSGPVDISAESLEYDKATETYVAKGNVEIREGTRILTADLVRYVKSTEDVYAEGKVVFQEQGDVIKSEKMYLNLLTKTGTIDKGRIFIKDGNFSIVGSEIQKVGENEYQVKKGQFTTCSLDGPGRPAWKFTADKANVTIDGYAKTKGMKFYILDTPVFYIPAGFFPVKTERQSGFLMPEFVTSSRDGFKFQEGYFWAISKDKDATFYSQFIEKRGVKAGAEFRYHLKEDLKGSWDAFIINDRDYNGTRWQIKGKHEQVFGEDLKFKANIDYVSDKDVLMDFGLTPTVRSENLLKSTAYIEKPFNRSLLTVEAAYFRNLTTRDNDSTFQYLPHATFFTESIPLVKNRLYADFASDLTTFYRDQGNRFTRWGIEPRVRAPFSWKGINFLLSGTLYETAYLVKRTEDDSGGTTAERHAARIQGDSNVQLVRNYNTSLFNLGQMQSIIKPNLRYTFIPNSGTSDIPSVDPYDRIAQQNTITYSFNHYLYAITPKTAREVSVLEVSQTYGLSGNLNESTDYRGYGNRLSDISSKLTIYPFTNFSYVTQASYSTSGNGLTSIYNTFAYKVPREWFVNLYHAYTQGTSNYYTYTQRTSNETAFTAGVAYKVFDFRYFVRYSFSDQDWIDTEYRLVYHPSCWALSLALVQSKRPNDTTFRIGVDLAGITSNIGKGGLIP